MLQRDRGRVTDCKKKRADLEQRWDTSRRVNKCSRRKSREEGTQEKAKEKQKEAGGARRWRHRIS